MTPERYQHVGQIYLAALELESDQRAAYLAEACVGDEALRQEIESLLEYQARSGGLIDQPILENAAQALADATTTKVIGQNFGHYRILSLLGKGGMGEVYLGEDTRLSRKVAIKLLPARFTTDAGRVRRFAQEARAASALNHPNIITIYEIGEAATENGSAHYIVTEYVEGETLRQRMTNAPHNRMKVAEAVDVAAQVAAALTAAHEAAIAHRDIKPENVMIRRDGYVKVLDFGLAKLIEPSAPGIDRQAPTAPGASTEAGIVIGTPRYMSPEQARGEKVDIRTDIFSLGVMLYEMVAGRAPFEGATPSETIASILRDEPAPLIRQVPEAPPELERIVCRALAKDRAERYQHQPAKDLLNDLNLLKQEMLIADPKNRKPQAAGRIRRIHILSGLAPLLLSAIAAWFYFSHPPVLPSKDAILLADFENKTGDAVFDGTLKQALEIQLQQSPFLNIFPEAQIRQTLRLMNRPPDARVTAEVAREICQRHDLKALIAGSIAQLGSHYVIALEAINSQSGESLSREQIEAESKEQVLRRLSQAATQLREKLGESLSSIQRFDRPLEQATTAKLEAFKAWSVGIEHSYGGRPMEAIPFYKRAVELDPDFAHAYSILSVAYSANGQLGLATEAAEKGYKLRDMMDEYEKLRITNFYHAFATGNLERRIEALTLQKQIYPHAHTGPTDLASTYTAIGQYDQAVAEAREAIRLRPDFGPARRGMVWPLLRLGRFAEAKDFIAQSQRQNIDPPDFHFILYQIAFIQGDAERMQEQIGWPRGRPDEYIAFDWQTGAAAFAGQWRKARDLARRAIGLSASGDTQEIAARYATEQALRGAVFGDCRQARADAAQGLKLNRGRVSLPRAALAVALCGQTDQARSLAGELSGLYPEDTLINSIWIPVIRAATELQRGNAAQAVDQLQTTSRYEAVAELWPQYLRGHAYLKLKQGAEATAEFQKILDHRGYAPLSPLNPLAHLGLARAAAKAGDILRSQKAYEDFLAEWKEADPDLPILIEAKREYKAATTGSVTGGIVK
jgi:eukaryotic-like serine/threonine-protein kinase